MRATRKPRQEKAKKPRRCKHTGRAVAILGVDVEAYACRKCDAAGVRSVGRSNDNSPAVQQEIKAARFLGHPHNLPDAWDAGSGGVEFGTSERDATAWPWSADRPLAGQHEEHLVRSAVTLDPVPDPNALAAVAIAGIEEPWHCPVESNECAIRRQCTNKCGLRHIAPEKRMDAWLDGFDLPDVPSALPALDALEYETTRDAEPDCRDEDGPEVERIMTEMAADQREPKHCDDYIDDESAPVALRAFLSRARSPAHGHLTSDPFPKLFADYAGERVRVVMASRLGDVGITADLQADCGYRKRVAVEDLANFGDAP